MANAINLYTVMGVALTDVFLGVVGKGAANVKPRDLAIAFMEAAQEISVEFPQISQRASILASCLTGLLSLPSFRP